MNPIRLLLGAILPVPIYCLGFALYSFNSILHHIEDMPVMIIFGVGYGYFIMGIPSVIYSFAIEALRSKENASPAICSALGSVIGFLFGSLGFLLYLQPIVFYTMALPGAVIGGIIPLLLSIKSENP